MKKLSSRLQSRLAKRRTKLSELDSLRQEGKELTIIGDRLLQNNVISRQEFDEHLHSYRHVRREAREMAQDQTLDKELLRMTYLHENQFFELGSARVMRGIDGAPFALLMTRFPDEDSRN